jgi:hypothetical protein
MCVTLKFGCIRCPKPFQFKGAQVWDFRSLWFSLFLHHKVPMRGRLCGKKKKKKYLGGSFGAAKFLTRMLSLILKWDFFLVWAKNFFFLEAFETICWCQWRFFQIFVVLGSLKIIENFEFLTRMLRPLCAGWAYGSGTLAHATRSRQELMRALGIRVRNWCVHWAYESGTDACTEHTRQVLMWAQSAVPSKHAEHTHQEMMRTLIIRVRNWCVHWAYTSGTDAHAQRAHQKLNDA